MSFFDWISRFFGGGKAKESTVLTPIPVHETENALARAVTPVPILEEREMDKFDRAMEFTLRWEGGYINHSADPGGETNFGIAKRSHPDVDIANLTEEKAKDIYREKYWDKIHGDELDPAVAVAVMDYAVNSGTSRSAKTLQKVVGTTADGAIGPATLKKVAEAVKRDGENAVAQAVVMSRVSFLCNLVKNKPSMGVFMHGWMKRTHQCMAEVSK
jgi:lysozyme family protein